MVKSNKGPNNTYRTLQNAVIAAISDPGYSFSLPQLSDWDSVVSSSVDEKERLEFVGDAIMHLSVALYLYRLFPDAAPGVYTNIRSVVNANATFTHLMVKAGAYKLPSQSHSTKAVADSFEVIVAALYMERGFPDVYAWVQEQYAPLVAVARESYDKCLTASDRNTPLVSTKRGPLDPAAKTSLLKKMRLSSERSSPRSTLMAQRIINRMKSKGKVKLYFPTKKPNLPLETRLLSCELCSPEPERLPSLVIDLTAGNDSDGEEVAPSSVMGSPQPNTGPLASFQNQRPLVGKISWSRSQLHPPSGSGQRSDTCTDFHPTLKRGPVLSHKTLSPASSTTATSSGSVSPITPQTSARFCRRPGPSLLPQSDNTHRPSGTYENPIVIEDSE